MSQPVVANLAQALEHAVSLHRQGDLARAEKIYARILKARRDHFDALHLLGLLKLDRPVEAPASFERLLAISPRHLEAQVNRANALDVTPFGREGVSL